MNTTCNCAGRRCGNRHLGTFVLRVVAGGIFVYVGWMKLGNLAATQNHFLAMHLSAWMATAVAWIELVGGIALILGLFTCFFASIFTIGMIVSAFFAWKEGGFNQAMLPILLAASAFALKHCGRGKWGMGRQCGCFWGGGKPANVCKDCGHTPGAGGGCDCGCHR